jgi:GNAT superfamily N-acetyltransferase
MKNNTRQVARESIRTVLAASCACQKGDLIGGDVVFTHAQEMPGRLRFAVHDVLVVTMGDGVVVSCSSAWEGWLRFAVGHLSRETIFSTETIAHVERQLETAGLFLRGPNLKYACSEESFQAATAPDGVEITVFEGEDIAELYGYHGFEQALSYQTGSERPDMVAAAAFQLGQLVGVAAAGADSELLWQIGVQVSPGARNAGIGRAVVSRVTREVLNAGRVPYYGTTVSHIRSAALARDLGYWPAWTDLYSSVVR